MNYIEAVERLKKIDLEFKGDSDALDAVLEVLTESPRQAMIIKCRDAVDYFDGNHREAARFLRIPKSTLWDYCQRGVKSES